jgi:hypothetical protein
MVGNNGDHARVVRRMASAVGRVREELRYEADEVGVGVGEGGKAVCVK